MHSSDVVLEELAEAAYNVTEATLSFAIAPL